MNDTPCTECNYIQFRISENIKRRDWKELQFWHAQRIAHRETCEVVNGGWYQGLWPTARVQAEQKGGGQ